MFKNFGLQVRKSGLDHAAFMRHWLNVHAPLSEGVPGVRGYVVNEVLEVLAPAERQMLLSITPPLDGIAQLWFDSQPAMTATAQTPEAKRWFGDGVNYLGARTGLASSEQLLLPITAPIAAARPRFKLLRLLRAQSSQSAATFDAAWSGAYARDLMRLRGICGYVQSRVSAVNPATNMPAVDVGIVSAVDELWFESQQAAINAVPLMNATPIDGNEQLLAASCMLLVHETVVIAPP
jgi:uncharacterized protein (TIGR02118 family)